MTHENKFALGVLQIADAHPQGLASFRRCKSDIPKYVIIDPDEAAPSATRPGEPMWHQYLRNIKSHDQSDWNYIYSGYLVHVPKVGYRITPAGTAYLRSKDL